MNEPNSLPTSSSSWSRHALVIAGGVGLTGIGLAAGLMLRSPAASPEVAMASDSASAPADATATTPTPVAPTATAAPAAAAVVAKAAPRHAPRRSATGSVARAEPHVATQSAALCTDCGVIEGVREVQQEGKGTGLGAVAGGVLGGVVGHQLGGGNGKTALTLLGAVGGGLAGNEVERRQRATTVYEVKVRMDDGTLRSFTQASAPAPGTRVTVDAHGAHVADRAGAPAPTYLRTSTTG